MSAQRRSQLFFDLCRWRGVVARRSGRSSPPERARPSVIHLPVGGQRQRVQNDEGRGDHVVGQLPLQRGVEAARQEQSTSVDHDVRHQAVVAGWSARARRPLANLVCRSRTASISPSSIRWPRIFTCWSIRPRYSMSPQGSHRARSPERYSRATGLATEGVGDESLGRQLGAVQVAAGHAGPADANLPRNSRRRRLPVGARAHTAASRGSGGRSRSPAATSRSASRSGR